MILRFVWFMVGLMICSLGVSFCVLYLNLLSMGYSFWGMVHFISRRWECHLLWIGILMMFFAWKGSWLHGLLLRCHTKF